MKEASETDAIPSKLTKYSSKFFQAITKNAIGTSITSLYLLHWSHLTRVKQIRAKLQFLEHEAHWTDFLKVFERMT